MLKFDNAWRFDSPGKIPAPIAREFSDIIAKISRGEQKLIEHFKRYFASAGGFTSSWSSSASWADSDLQNYMDHASENAPLFIEAFYDACEDLRNDEALPAPDVFLINKILAKHHANYQINPPNLVALGSAHTPTPPEIPVSLDQKAQEVIQTSISEGQRLMSEGRHRQAVQEVLWLLETVSTAFQGMNNGENSVEGKYFNKIVEELRRNNQGTTLEQIIGWITKLHGYLSAPSGGGIRHGMHLKEGVATTPSEARLYCNLIISYVSFLLSEYERLKTSD